MRFILLLSVWLGFLAWITPGTELLAQEIVTTEPIYSPIATPTDRVIEFFNTPDQIEHSGLLGKIYVQGRYVDQGVNAPRVSRYDKSRQGYDTLINLPVFTLDTPQPIDFDLFFGYANDRLDGSSAIGQIDWRGFPYFREGVFNLSSKTVTYDIGTSIYLNRVERLRPFVQIGARFIQSDLEIVNSDYPAGRSDSDLIGYGAGIDMLIADDRLSMNLENDGYFYTNHRYSMRETRLLLNTGFEFDICDSLAYRLTLFTETKGQFQDSVVSNDLICWPINRVFLRGGLITQLDGGHLGFSIGGGLVF